jgi:hypothetical protein
MGKAWKLMGRTLAVLAIITAGCNREKEQRPSVAESPEAPAGESPDDAETPRAEAEAADSGMPDVKGPAPQGAAESDSQAASSLDEVARGESRIAEQFSRLPPPDEAKFPNLQALSPEHDVWIDGKNNRVVMRGGVCLREGQVELFACIHQWVEDERAEGGRSRRGTKEYESLVTVNTTASLVHTALLAVGAEEGTPVQFAPEYKPATGTVIDVALHWTDESGEPREAPAQQWLRNTKTQEAMSHPWVFAGSDFIEDPNTGERRYLGEEGNLICVSNFADAVLDVPVPSSAANDALLFEAFTENMPPLGTPLTIVLTPRPDGAGGDAETTKDDNQ